MKADDLNLKPQYRMPRVFGALPGPRNVPKDKQNLPDNQTELTISVTARTDPKLLAELLPPDCTLDGEPLLTIRMMLKSNIGWLAGRGYNILMTSFRIAHESKTLGRVTGNFVPVVWENLADPILTGREELGFAKIYAEMPPPVIIGNSYSAIAAWQGFRFFEIEVNELVDAPPQANASGNFHYKFIPRTGALGEADVAYLEYSPPSKSPTGYSGGDMSVKQHRIGKGKFKFHPARWEDVPFQYPIINALAALPCHEIVGASVTAMEANGAIGNPGAGGLTEIT